MELLKRRIVADVERISGHHGDPDLYGGPAGDPGLIGPNSMSWEIHSDLAAIAHAGTAAIVLEILHPSVVAGVQDFSIYRQDPFQRARATLGYVLATTFGNTAAATAVIERVKSIHSHVHGTRPDGIAYAALDPELLAWVHTCIPWMILRTFERTNRALTPHERGRYLTEQAVIGRMGGAHNVPCTTDELNDYIAGMRPLLSVNAQTRDFIEFLLTAPILPPLPRGIDTAAHRFTVSAAMRFAPRWARELTGFDTAPAMTRLLAGPALHLDVRRIRWALGTPAYARMAAARAQATPTAGAVTG